MFHVKHESWGSAAAALEVALTPASIAKLDRYEALLIERGVPMGIVAPGDLPRLRERHLLDCLRAAPLIRDARTAYDLGSGGGLPGVIIAIVRPELQITLVEVRRNRASFLETIVKELDLAQVSVYPRRAETLRARVELCLARAFKPARVAWTIADAVLERDGRVIYWAGRSFDPRQDVPEGVAVELFRTPALARSGGLAIMSRQ